MIDIFKRQPKIQIIILITTWVLIGIEMFLFNNSVVTSFNILPMFNLNIEFDDSYLIISKFITWLLIGLQALLISLYSQANNLINRNNWLASFIYLLLISFQTENLILSPVLIANTFIIFAVQKIFQIYEAQSYLDNLIIATLLIAIATLIYFPAIVFMVMIWITLIIFARIGWRAWVISIIGFLLLFLYLFTWHYLNDEILEVIPKYITFFNHDIKFKLIYNNYAILFSIVFGLISILALIKLYIIAQDKLIKVRKKYLALIPFFLISIISFIISNINYSISLSIIFIPASFVFSIYLTYQKNEIISNIFLYILLILLVIGNLKLI